MKSNESAENYLETILILSKKKPVVRSVDIADELGFKKSSVSVAMKNLREKNHITVTPEATSDACRIEHVISPESFTAIKEHLSPGK